MPAPGNGVWRRETAHPGRAVVIDVSGELYLDLEREAAAVLARE